MTETRPRPGGDRHRPIECGEQDRLGRDGFAHRLAEALIRTEDAVATGYVIGLAGPWGSGKSSLLNLVAQSLRERYGQQLVLLRFNPWLLSGRDDLIRAFLLDFAKVLPDEATGSGRAVTDLMRDYAGRMAPMAAPIGTLFGATGIGTAMGNALRRFADRSPSINDIKEKLTDALRALKRPIIVLIDELDRAEPEEVRAMAQLIRAVADFPNVSYLVGYDSGRVHHALGEGDEALGRAYLEKIISLQFDVPQPDEGTLMALLRAELQLPEHRWHAARMQRLIGLLVPNSLRNLRDLWRSLDTFSILDLMTHGEVEAADLLAVTALKVKYADSWGWFLQTWPRHLPQLLSDEAQTVERLRPPSASRVPWKALLPGSDTVEPAALFRFIFGAMQGTDETGEPVRRDEAELPGLLRGRHTFRILTRLDRLTDVPTIEEARAILLGTTEATAAALEDFAVRDALPQLLEQIASLALHETKDQTQFWLGASHFLDQWAASPDPERINQADFLSRKLADLLGRQAQVTSPAFQAAGRQITGALLKAGDHHLAPRLLARLRQQHGLFGDGQGADPGAAYCDRETTLELTRRYKERLDADLEKTDIFKRISSATFLVLANELNVLQSSVGWRSLPVVPDADQCARFVMLFFGRPNSASIEYLEALFGRARFTGMVNRVAPNASDVLAEAVAKANAAYRGQPHE